jgi:serine-type D-Ala-D-Ala carboxypeptidase (penicillin-binding protein 5/6)
VAQSVLTKVERRRPRRSGRAPFALLVIAALAGAGVFTFRHFDTHTTPAAAAPPPAKAPAEHHAVPARPLTLLTAMHPLHGRPVVSARAAILVDSDTGRVLWEKLGHRRRPIASTTKIMTATLVLEHLPLGTVVRVPPAATRTPLVREGLRRNERVPAWKLLDGLLIFSGNDDAYALAAATAGSRASFVKLMNEKARVLGLRDTHFTSVSGVIDDGNYSSAWDLAALARYAMRDSRFRRIVSTRIARLKWSAPTFDKVYVNKNQLLGRYPGADGVKTGWTTLAGHCLVASAHRGGHGLIAVLLHAQDPYGDARRLLNFGFSRTGS